MNLVERIARGLCRAAEHAAWGDDDTEALKVYAECGAENREEFIDIAWAGFVPHVNEAISEFLTLSDAMLASGVEALIDRGFDGPDGIGFNDVRAVIDAVYRSDLVRGEPEPAE